VASGAKTDRAQLRRIIEELDSGDVPLVTRPGRLAYPFEKFGLVRT
jgi:DNA invertase Pin-like site-specific DNA recombinase